MPLKLVRVTKNGHRKMLEIPQIHPQRRCLFDSIIRFAFEFLKRNQRYPNECLLRFTAERRFLTIYFLPPTFWIETSNKIDRGRISLRSSQFHIQWWNDNHFRKKLIVNFQFQKESGNSITSSWVVIEFWL